MNNWKKIVNELSYRVSSGIPDLTNEQHLMKLWEILKEHNWNIDARVELLKNLQEVDQSLLKTKITNPTTQRQIQVRTGLGYKKSNTAAYNVAKSFLKDKGVSDDEIEKQADKSAEDDVKKEKPKTKEFFKDIKKIDTLNSDEYKKPLDSTKDEFDKSNEKNQTPSKFELSEDSRKALTKVAPKYVDLLERVLNTNRKGDGSDKLDYFGVGGGQGAGTTKSAMGELMTQAFSTLRSDELFGKKDENGMYSGGLYRDIAGHLDKLEQDGVQTHIDKSWVRAAMENRSAIMAHFREKFGNDYEIVATSWDVPSEVESLGLSYKDKQSTTDTFFKVKDKDGNERVLECSLKKSFSANLYNGSLQDVIKNADTQLNVGDFADKQLNNLNNVYEKNQQTMRSVIQNINLDSEEAESNILDIARVLGGGKINLVEKAQKELFETIKQTQEDLLSNPELNIDRDYIGNVTQAGKKKGKVTMAKRATNKNLLMLLQMTGKYDEGLGIAFDNHKKITSDFEESTIKELNENETFKQSVLDKCRDSLPLEDIIEGKEFMAAGKTPVTKKTLEAMFGTSDWNKVKENLEVDLEPVPTLVYKGKVDDSDRTIKFANIVVREDGKGYSGGAVKFELKFNNNFRDFAAGESQDIYDQHRPEGGQIPIPFKKKKK
ncbi:MAG: hypothetical protein CBD63_04095 [Candidatus Pelagibacter sp. TMED203]|nr:MAG: hypothetical protein CBD63_04095 [Candidatus Pelagibacter sp. TMED203]|tara:strand:+ start:727 stop:2706 length:1980 start_codon:yes stop_codon:yes gene_type:complete